MTISSTTIKNSYAGNGSTTAFTFTYYIISEDDLEVIIRSSNGTETLKSLTTHYTVTGVQNNAGGTVTMLTAPASGETIVIRRKTSQVQDTDYVANDPFPAETHEAALDKAMLVSQELQEAVDRSIKISRTNTMTSTDFTVGATERANKVLAFDSSGEISVTQELGTYQGNWSTSTSYQQRDLIKDTTNDNVYMANTAHTSSGALPISSNTDSAKWDLIVDAAAATASATAAASSATAAAASATSAASSATAAASSETDAQTAQTAAETAQTGAETAETNATTQATNAASSATSAATSASAASTSATAAASSASAASTSATNAATSATSAATYATNAATSYDNFDDRYLGSKSSDPTLDNDGNALLTGALYWNTTSNITKIYTGSAWENIAQNSIDAAATSASNAATSATNAATSASNASTSETNAASSETNAATSETNASNSASAASTSATNASNSASAAAASAASAANSYDQFDDRYLGSKTADPTLDNDGNALVAGALYFNSTANEMRVYDGGNWIPASSAGTASLILYEYTATSGQTTFSGTDDNSATLSYSVNNLIVTLNGITLDPSDYTATSGTSIVLGTGATTGDLLNVYAFKSFTVSELNANNLTDGTIPDARFPAVLPAISGANLTGIISDVVEDTTPQLGGSLDLNSNNITGTGNVNITGTVTATSFSGDGSSLSGITSTTINNNADNRVITGSGTANTLEGEANFAYDGTNVIIGSDTADFSGLGGTYTGLNLRAGSGYSTIYGQTTATTTNSSAVSLVGGTSGASAGAGAELLGVIQIACESDSSTNATGQIRFFTGSGGSVSEKMKISSSGHLLPNASNTYDLGSSSLVWRNIYTSDFHMSNEGLDKGNDIDGTKGSWTFQEGEENLYLINNKNGKKYKFNLTEIE